MMRWSLAFAALLLAAQPAQAAPPLEAYGRLPSMDQPTIAPDGGKIAFVFGVGGSRRLTVETPAREVVLQMDLGVQKLRSLEWAGSDHLILALSATGEAGRGVTRKTEFAVGQLLDLTRGRVRLIKSNAPDSIGVLLSMPQVRSVGGKPMIVFKGLRPSGGGGGGLTLLSMDPATGRTSLLDSGSAHTTDWAVDEGGRPIARIDYDDDTKLWTLNLRRNDVWYAAQSMTAPLDPPALEGLGRAPGAIVLSRQGAGRDELREISAVDGAPGALLSDKVSDIVDDRGTHRAIGGPGLRPDLDFVFFDPADEAQWGRIVRAFKGAYVEPVDWSADRRRLIVLSVGPKYGAAYFFVDLKAGRADLIADLYSGVGPADIAPVKVIAYKAADGLEIPAYLTLPRDRPARGLPLVVLPHGGPNTRDKPGFDWWAQALASRGYAVLQPQYRGSEGFGGALMTAGYGEWGRKMQTDLSDGVRFLAADGTIDPRRVCIVGGSYGGYAALAGVTLEHGVYRCAVSVAGPSDMIGLLRWIGGATFRRDNLSVRNWTRLMGAPNARDPALNAISPARLADRVDAPILLIHGKDDTVVPFAQSQAMADALKKAGKTVRLVPLDGEDHWLSHSETRLQMLTETVTFLEANNPPG